mmetsp:Transcript_8685/g.32027  ORF Transcript_8685/g.32027 Transcript_8685/m.32027 type:complete len:220 (+) Transcript_8685:1142-1801(+)
MLASRFSRSFCTLARPGFPLLFLALTPLLTAEGPDRAGAGLGVALPIGVPRGLLPTGDTSSGGEARPVWGGGAAIDGSGTVVGASTSTSPFGSRGATLSFIVLTSCSLWFTRFFSRSTASSSFRSCSFISRFLRAFSSLRRFFSALRASSAFSVAVVSMVPPSLCVTSSAAPFVAPPGTTTVPPAGPSSSEALRFNLDNSSSARSGAFAPPAAPPPGRL